MGPEFFTSRSRVWSRVAALIVACPLTSMPPPANAQSAEQITVRAHGTLLGNVGPQMQLFVNGAAVGSHEVRATAYQDYVFSMASVPTGARVDVVFNNDASDARADRNLFVESIRVKGSTILSSAPGVAYDRGWGSGAFDGRDVITGRSGMLWNGALRFSVGTAIPSGYTLCAAEGQRCNFNGAADVIYGTGAIWTAARGFTGGVACNNATFGDPVYGVVKSCYRSAAPAPVPNSTLTVSAQGSGSVVSSPAGINCGASCAAEFGADASVALTATPAAGQRFAGWGGACSGTASCTVSMGTARSVTATFAPSTHALTISTTGSGSVTSNAPAINCAAVCSANVAPGTNVTLTATPAAGYRFASWGGACVGSLAGCTLQLSQATAVTATFSLAPGSSYDLSARINAVRAHTDYGHLFRDTSDPHAPGGLELPSPPNVSTCGGSLAQVYVSTLAALRSEASGSCKQITLAPGTYAETASIPAIHVTGRDLRISLAGSTISTRPDEKGLVLARTVRRVEILGGTINSGFQLEGRDIKVFDVAFLGQGVYEAGNERPSNGGGLGGHRILMERCFARLADGAFFTGAATESFMTGSIVDDVLTVTQVHEGQLAVGQKIVGITTAVAPGTAVIAQLGGVPGGAGTYRVSGRQSAAAGNMFARTRSTNLILANSNIEVPVLSGARGSVHENPVRFNGVHFGLVMDSRLWAQQKFTWRVHPDYSTLDPSGTAGIVRVQSERIGGTSTIGPGVYPAVGNVVVDDWRLYRPFDASTGGRFQLPHLATLGIESISGNGALVTVRTVTMGFPGHGFRTGDVVTIQGAAPAGYNMTAAVTVVDAHTFTYPNPTLAAATSPGVILTDKVNTSFVYAKGVKSYSAPHEGVAGAALMPDSHPPAAWATVRDPSAALSNGNSFEPYVLPPAWSFR